MTQMPRSIWWGLTGIVGVMVVLTIGAWILEINPPVKQEPNWDSPQTKALAQRACYDCHSNETQWPLYDKLPVSSWLAVWDTVRGRRNFNLSEWGVATGGERTGAREIARSIDNGSMPPSIYTLMHPEAVLSAQEKQQLIQGLQNSLQ